MRIEPHDYHAVASIAPDGRPGSRTACERPHLGAARAAGRRGRAASASRRRRRTSVRCVERRATAVSPAATRSRSTGSTPTSPGLDEQWGGPVPGDDDLPVMRVMDGEDRRETAAPPRGRAARAADGAGRSGLRHGHRRRRARGPRRGGLRRIRGVADDRDRAGSSRRPGGNVVAHRELPRVPGRRLRRRAREPSAGAGATARGRDRRDAVDHAHRRVEPPRAPRRR